MTSQKILHRGAESARRLPQAGIDLLQDSRDRKHHEGQRLVQELRHDRPLGVEQLDRFLTQAESHDDSIHEPSAAQEDDPSVGPNHDVHDERGHHEDRDEISVSR